MAQAHRVSGEFYKYRSSSVPIDDGGHRIITQETFQVAQSRILNQTFIREQTLNSALASGPVDGCVSNLEHISQC